MESIYQKITQETKEEKEFYFEIKGEKFRTFIDSDKDYCLTHYSKNYPQGENAWFIGDAIGLEYKINNLI